MKKNLLDTDTEEQIITRIVKLSPASKGLWGNMTVNEMLFHCRKINNDILHAEPQNKTPTVKQNITKFIGLYLMKEFPKGVITGSQFLPSPTDNIEFQKVQTELINSSKEVAAYKNAIYGEHPFFRPLHTKEWRRFIWKHLDHHLRQFNV